MQSLRRGTLYVVLAATLGAAWACSSDSSTPTPASSGSASGSSGSAASGSAASGSSGSATSGSSGSATSGSSGSATSGSGSGSSGSSGAGDDGGGMAGDDGGGIEAATTVPETGAPAEAGLEAGAPEGGATGDGGGATFTAVYAIIQTSCLPCHAAGTGVTGGMLDMSTKAMAYTNLVGKPAAGAACMATGGTRVVPGMAATSLLYNKVSAAAPQCGMRMPRGRPALPMADIMLIRSWINAGALNN